MNKLFPSSGKAPIVITVITCILHVWLLNVSKRFIEVFEGFGAELPMLTKLFLPGSVMYYLLPAAAIIALLGHPLGMRSAKTAFSLISISSGLFIPAFIIAMYLPIFQLGSVVSN